MFDSRPKETYKLGLDIFSRADRKQKLSWFYLWIIEIKNKYQSKQRFLSETQLTREKCIP